MKRALCILLLLAAVPAILFAQEDFFPLGSWISMYKPAITDSAKKCGFNVVQMGYMYDSTLNANLALIKAAGMKCFIVAAPPSGSGTAVIRHNLERFAGGIYMQYEADHLYFTGRTVGSLVGTDMVCDSGQAGYALYRPSLNAGPWWTYRNCVDCRMPFVAATDTMDTTNIWHNEKVRYTVRFRMKYQGGADGSPVCRIRVDTMNWWAADTFKTVDSCGTVACDTITTADFAGPDVYKTFELKFTRYAGQTRWIDFPVETFGNKRLFVDWVEMQDAVYDSLVNDQLYGQVYSEAIRNIADIYSGPNAPNKEAVFRYYMYDEPVRSQLESYRRVNDILRDVNPNYPGFTIVVTHYPPSTGNLALTDLADTVYYTEFVQKTSPAQLAVDILPLFGDRGDLVAAPEIGVGSGIYRTPSDSGYYFQRQMDALCKRSRAAGRAVAGRNIPWWIQIQSFGDYEQSDTASPSGRWRLPTPRELKCMTNLCLAHGAQGVFDYHFSGGAVMQYGGYTGNFEDKWYQLAVVDTAGNVRDTALYNAAKDINSRITALAPVLLNLAWESSFRNTAGGVITGISDSLIQIGLLHHKTNANDKYFMLVNRHCLPTDTLTVTVNINSTEPFFVSDILTGQPATGQLPAGANVPFSYKLQPGEGRLFRIVPFTAQIKINQNATYTNFKFVQVDDPASSSLHSVDSVQITQKYYVKVQPDTAARPDYISYYWAADVSAWLPYSASSIKYLESSMDNKANIFELQFKIGGGKILTPKYSAQIYFNNDSPATGSITVNSGAAFTNSQTVNVKLYGTDLFPGLYKMRYAEAPFGNTGGYVNHVTNGTFGDTTNWLQRSANLDSGYAFIDRARSGGIQIPEDFGAYIAQPIPAPTPGQLMRLRLDIYGIVQETPVAQIYGRVVDELEGGYTIYYLDRYIDGSNFIYTGNTTLTDTFTFYPPVTGTLQGLMLFVGYHGNVGYPMTTSSSIWPQITSSHLYVDNIRLEPVELKYGEPTDINPPLNSYIYDGWDYVDTSYSLNYSLSASDGAKRVYMQLKDLPGNISTEPGWYDEIILDMTKPVANIGLPLTASYINGWVSVYGSATDIHFKNWVLDYKPYSSGDWQSLARSDAYLPDFNPGDLLHTWNTDNLRDGTYLLRLTSYDLAENVKADTHYVYVMIEQTLPVTAITSDFAIFNSLPVDAACDNFGNIYVTDTQADKIWKFSPEGDSLLCFGYKYTCQDTLGLNHPKGIAVDDSGNIWITDCYQSKVKKYDSSGNYLSTIGKHGNNAGEFNQPTGIAISGNEIYVVDHLNDRVQVFNKAGAFIRQFGNNCLKQPAGIAIRQNESIKLVYVCDSQNDRIAIFDTTGNLVNSIDSLGLDKPWDICVDNNNNLYIADVYNNRVIELDPWHNKLLTFGIQGQEAGQFKLPQGLAVSPDGKYLYVTDTHNDRLQRFKMFFDLGSLGGPQLASKRQITNSAPTVFGLSQCFPNPCQQLTTINYQLAKPGQVSLKVYNTLGQAVKTLVNENQQPGYYTINWDGRDEVGRQAATGIYFYRLKAGSFSSTKKAVVLR